MLILAGFTALVAWLELYHWKLPKDHPLRSLSLLHTSLSFVLSLLLVFRTNTAYDRWWEGRKLWGGLVNSSRNMAIKINALIPVTHKEHRDFFRKAIPLYAKILKSHLALETTRLELDSEAHPELGNLDYSKHLPNQVAMLIAKRLFRIQQEGIITPEQLLMLNNELNNFTDTCGACERIKNTPIPLSYSVFIKKFIFIYSVTLPFGYVFNLEFWAIPVVLFIFFVLASLELIAEEIEDPFGGDENDLPLEKIVGTITRNIEECLA